MHRHQNNSLRLIHIWMSLVIISCIVVFGYVIWIHSFLLFIYVCMYVSITHGLCLCLVVCLLSLSSFFSLSFYRSSFQFQFPCRLNLFLYSIYIWTSTCNIKVTISLWPCIITLHRGHITKVQPKHNGNFDASSIPNTHLNDYSSPSSRPRRTNTSLSTPPCGAMLCLFSLVFAFCPLFLSLLFALVVNIVFCRSRLSCFVVPIPFILPCSYFVLGLSCLGLSGLVFCLNLLPCPVFMSYF